MDKSIIIRKALAALITITVVCSSGYAQTDPAAKTLLDKVSRTYEKHRLIKADFTVAVQQPGQAAGQVVESGTLYMETSTGKYSISMKSQELISDGKTQWMVLKEEKEIQVTDADQSSEAISPVNIFSFYKTGYKYVSAPAERVGSVQLNVVELSPEDRTSPYFKIKLRVNNATNMIHDLMLFDKGGSRYTYTITGTKTDPAINAGKFTFNPRSYPSFEIVDLR
jgi:Outer membrane lipoprotein-sorting protein